MNDLQKHALLSPERAAEALDISRAQLYRLMKSGGLAFVMLGSHRRIPHSEIERVSREGASSRVA